MICQLTSSILSKIVILLLKYSPKESVFDYDVLNLESLQNLLVISDNGIELIGIMIYL